MMTLKLMNPLNPFKLQQTSYEVWDSKYRLKDDNGNPIDQTVDDSFKRVSGALAQVETRDQELWYERFLFAMRSGAIPAGRIMSNAGAEQYKPKTSLINCVVSDQINDDMYSILNKLRDAGMTLKAGCGIGYEFSTLRPKGAYVAGSGAHTSGPLSFMDVYDKMCFTISSAGGRRGAQMATFDIRHPDVIEFIKAKREAGRLRQFNLSLLITDDFMEAVKENSEWKFTFPLDSDNVYKTISARDLWNMIIKSNYEFAEPGFLLIDEINRMNNNWFCENIRATNPCGEQPLPYNGSCLLGSIDLTQFVKNPFTSEACFDWGRYAKIIRIFTRMLDNVVELNGLSLEGHRKELELKRRHGMGYFGLGSVFSMLNMSYGSPESIKVTQSITEALAIEGYFAGLELSMEKGPAPIMEDDFEVTDELRKKRPELFMSHRNKNTVKGKYLHANSEYMQRIAKLEPELVMKLETHGCRFTHHSSIAPTGTIALSFGNNASNGIEPSFSHHYFRNVIQQGKNTKNKTTVYSKEALIYANLFGKPLPDWCLTANQITPQQHIDIQAAAQYWVDSSISKTVNVPSDCSMEDFNEIYLYAYEMGLKGCATFRFNPDAFQGVLVTQSDLDNTTYQFTLEDGSIIEATGSDTIEYDDELHGAANLFDALKEGLYGKF